MIYICSHGNERKHWICPPYLFFLLLWLCAISCYYLFLFFLQSCASSYTTSISSSPLFLMFSFNSFCLLPYPLNICIHNNLSDQSCHLFSFKLPIQVSLHFYSHREKNAAVEPVFCSVGGLSPVSQEVSTPRASQADYPPRFHWLGYPNWIGPDLGNRWVQLFLERIPTSWFLFFGLPPRTIYILLFIIFF